jgi:hypothetical protein
MPVFDARLAGDLEVSVGDNVIVKVYEEFDDSPRITEIRMRVIEYGDGGAGRWHILCQPAVCSILKQFCTPMFMKKPTNRKFIDDFLGKHKIVDRKSVINGKLITYGNIWKFGSNYEVLSGPNDILILAKSDEFDQENLTIPGSIKKINALNRYFEDKASVNFVGYILLGDKEDIIDTSNIDVVDYNASARTFTIGFPHNRDFILDPGDFIFGSKIESLYYSGDLYSGIRCVIKITQDSNPPQFFEKQ